MVAGAQRSARGGYNIDATLCDQQSRRLSAFSASKIGDVSVGREVGDGGSCRVRRTAASAFGKKKACWRGIGCTQG
jgi:hypothetical protein